MISKYNHKELTWIDLEDPKESELSHVIDLYSIPDFIKDALDLKNNEDSIRLDNDYIFISFNLPQYFQTENAEINSKIILIVNDNFILTIHEDPIPALNIFSKEMELDIIRHEKINNNQLLFIYFLKSLFVSSEDRLVKAEIQIQNLKEQILNKNKKVKLLKRVLVSSLVIIILIIIYALSHI